MNFGFAFDDKQKDLQEINLAFYKKVMNDKLSIISNNGIDDKKGKHKDTKADWDSDSDSDEKTKKNEKKANNEVKDGIEASVIPGKKRRVKVLIIIQAPYVYRKGGEYTGIVYDIWKGIKVELASKYDFEEKFFKTLNYTRQLRRVQTGEFDMAISSFTTNARRTRMVNFSRPIYINQHSIITVPQSNYLLYLSKLFFNLFLPPLLLLILFGIVFGNILYFIEPHRGHKRAMFSSIASMFGEMGMISENTKLSYIGVTIAFIIMTVSFYFSIFLQAATVEKLMEYKQNEEITVDNIQTKKLLYPMGSGVGNAFKTLGAEVKGVKVEEIDELKQKYIDEMPKWDGIAMPFMDAHRALDDRFVLNDENFGLSEQAIAVRIGQNRLLKDLDIAITKLQDSYEVKKQYSHYFGEEHDYMGIL